MNTALIKAGGIGIGVALVLVAHRFGRPKATFVAVSVVALVLYGTVPFTAAEETTTAVWLNVMHVAAALPIVGLLARQLPGARARTERPQPESGLMGATS